MTRAAEMRAVFARLEESGLSLKAFGEREGISYSTLQYWRRKLRDEASAKRASRTVPAATVLAPVRVVPDPTRAEARPERFDVWLANGVSVEVPAGFDELELRRLVGVLSTC